MKRLEVGEYDVENPADEFQSLALRGDRNRPHGPEQYIVIIKVGCHLDAAEVAGCHLRPRGKLVPAQEQDLSGRRDDRADGSGTFQNHPVYIVMADWTGATECRCSLLSAMAFHDDETVEVVLLVRQKRGYSATDEAGWNESLKPAQGSDNEPVPHASVPGLWDP